METISLTDTELQQLELLLKKLHKVDAYLFNGTTWQKWQDGRIVSIENTEKRQIVRVKR